MTDSHDSDDLRGGLPLLSIVIPVYNVADYLGDCLDSITQQSFHDLEIIAVQGASTDSSAAILDDRAAREARLTVNHLDPPPGQDRVGPGRARNAGLACAKGDYIWFVDGDDAITPGCLATIARRLSADSPDVLLVGHELVSPDGEHTKPGYDQQLLREVGDQPFTLAEHPAVVGLSMASWNKIVRREFLLSTETWFLDEWPHEDIPVSCAVLIDAPRISVLNLACYRYREDRPGSAMLTSNSAAHFNVFNVWQGVLEAARVRRDAGDPAVTAEVYAALFERSIWHLTNNFDKHSVSIRRHASHRYVSGGNRRTFFGRMHALYATYKPADFQRPARFRGIKFTLVEKDAYCSYLILAQFNGIRLWLGRTLSNRPAG